MGGMMNAYVISVVKLHGKWDFVRESRGWEDNNKMSLKNKV
jgi:hypothetical protein